VVSFDNATPEITGGIAVTSVEANIDAMCEAAVNAVLAPEPGGKVFFEARIFEKDSVAPPRE